MSDGKTYDGMRKIFKLTDLLPAEIMYNGNADFENFSMETLISKFKNTVDFEELGTVENIKNEFINFLSQNTQSTDFNDYLREILDDFNISMQEFSGFFKPEMNCPFFKRVLNFRIFL